MDQRDHQRRPVPIIDSERCTGCGLCCQVCPTAALSIKRQRAYVARPDRCDYTGYCEQICPERAIERPFQIVVSANKGE